MLSIEDAAVVFSAAIFFLCLFFCSTLAPFFGHGSGAGPTANATENIRMLSHMQIARVGRTLGVPNQQKTIAAYRETFKVEEDDDEHDLDLEEYCSDLQSEERRRACVEYINGISALSISVASAMLLVVHGVLMQHEISLVLIPHDWKKLPIARKQQLLINVFENATADKETIKQLVKEARGENEAESTLLEWLRQNLETNVQRQNIDSVCVALSWFHKVALPKGHFLKELTGCDCCKRYVFNCSFEDLKSCSQTWSNLLVVDLSLSRNVDMSSMWLYDQSHCWTTSRKSGQYNMCEDCMRYERARQASELEKRMRARAGTA